MTCAHDRNLADLDRDVKGPDELLTASCRPSASAGRSDDRHALELDLPHALEYAARDARHIVKGRIKLELRGPLIDRIGRGVEQVQGRDEAVDPGRVARQFGEISAEAARRSLAQGGQRL